MLRPQGILLVSGVIHDLGKVFAHQMKGCRKGFERCEQSFTPHPVTIIHARSGGSVAAPGNSPPDYIEATLMLSYNEGKRSAEVTGSSRFLVHWDRCGREPGTAVCVILICDICDICLGMRPSG